MSNFFFWKITRRVSALMDRYDVMGNLPLWARLDAAKAITWKGTVNEQYALPILTEEQENGGAWELTHVTIAGSRMAVHEVARYKIGYLDVFLADCPGNDEDNWDRSYCLVRTLDGHAYAVSEWKHPKTTFAREPE